MIIGIDASRANLKEKTGTEWYAYHLIEEIKKLADSSDQFILYSKEKLEEPLACLPKNFTNKVLDWPPKLLWTQLRLAWEMLWHKPDILFVPAHTMPIIHPRKTVTTLHDVGFERFKELYSKKDIGFNNAILNKILKIMIKIFTWGKYSNTELDYHRWSARLALKKAQKIITISEFTKNEIIKFFKVNSAKITVIYSAFNPDYRQPKDRGTINNILQKFKITEPFFLYLGRLEEKKNTAGLIEGFGRYKQENQNNNKLVLVGKPGFGFDKVQREIKKWKIEKDVIILGWVENEDLPHLMKAAEIFIFPSFYEGFGMPILEAMASGTPVITSNYGAMKEIADQAALLVDPSQPETISQAITKIQTNQDLYRKLVEKGYKRASLFSWQKTAHKTLQLIKSL